MHRGGLGESAPEIIGARPSKISRWNHSGKPERGGSRRRRRSGSCSSLKCSSHNARSPSYFFVICFGTGETAYIFFGGWFGVVVKCENGVEVVEAIGLFSFVVACRGITVNWLRRRIGFPPARPLSRIRRQSPLHPRSRSRTEPME